ncbi:hypothetical protein BCR37DRAFT_386531 [Protomyces lactucae-debilis]|uniref:Uncharacterized protein n=1 Tax=Protomyces lactucae-debilis TaxID=2754530 RepID=A0A1Y2FK99_PROLT|nr:uncharacterized protein BCR37DRAFT_386531 [Protomyces lactucae-debilis]ORY84359.1 hypothetical protein BCR37DRAFT_386531 [Protomyces lactucae-debilis]
MHFPPLDYVLIIAASAQLMQQASAKATHGMGEKKHTDSVAKATSYSVDNLPAVTPTSLSWYLAVKKNGTVTYKRHRLDNQDDCNEVSECYWGLQDKTIAYHPQPVVTYPYRGIADAALFYCMWDDPDSQKNTGDLLYAPAYPVFHQCSPFARTTLEKDGDGKEREVTRIIPNCSVN